MNNRNAKFLCLDCSQDTKYEHYFIHTSLWLSIVGSTKGMMCIGCFEKRLGRKLLAGDFTNAYINRINFGAKSLRLIERLTSI